MRILAIRGQNLASLVGEFAIDFTAEPLAGSGIFAITGPTGAGKSTLLDAACLALFNDIPRLKAAPASGRIGGDEDSALSLRDTRAILRHGTAEGYAEVDFAMPAGATYRARWAVRRARGKADGQLQNISHSFERLDTAERLGGTRTETLNAISAIIGLSAEQFGRAVLLAQGDFEAFIRADANDRAILLEKLTGSEIYAALGQRAYEKAKGLNEGLETIRNQIAAQNGLDDEQRTLAEAELAVSREAEVGAIRQQAALNVARQWEERAASLGTAIGTARGNLADCHAQSEAAAPRRDILARDRRALAHASAWIACSEAATARDDARDRAERETEALDLAKSAEAAAIKAEAETHAACAERAAEATALAPVLDAARKLDIRLVEAAARLAAAGQDAREGQAKFTAAAQVHTAAFEQHQATERAHRDEQDWLAKHPALEPLAAREDELATQLAEHAAQVAATARDQAERDKQEQAQQDALAQWNAGETALRSAGETHVAARAALTKAEAALPPESRFTELTEARDELVEIAALLAAHGRAEEALALADAAIATTRTRQAEAKDRRSTLIGQQTMLKEEADALSGSVKDARRELDLLTAAANDAAMALRAALTPGEPCPVCGAAEHHLEVFEGRLGDHLRARREGLAVLEADHSAAKHSELQAGAELKALAEQAPHLERELTEQAGHLDQKLRERDAASTKLDAAANKAGLPPAPDALPDALAARRLEVDGALASLITARQACADARTVELTAREALDTARTNHTAAREALDTRTRAIADLDIELKSRRAAAERLATGLDRWLAPVADWRALPDADAWLVQQAKEWRTHAAVRDSHAAKLAGLRDAVTRTETELAACRTRAGELGTALEVVARAHADLTEERAGLLDGDSVTTVELRLVAARKHAEAAHHEAGKTRETATNARTAAETRHTECCKQHEDAEAALTRREQIFTQALTTAGIAAEDVERVARAGAAALEAEASALALIDSALEKAQAILREREADLAQHEQTDPPLLIGPDLTAALTAAEAEREAAAEGRGEAELKLRLDDAVRERTAQLRAELEHKTAEADVWLRLADLIGDAKGANFRRFAQGLTLDRLLEHANARLTELKPRFTLERGAGGDMLIQVLDNDMAGEVRGLHNLSGGERFLVSLSLALGLAEMSTAGGVKIESLFIDEGFGALDPESLGQAIALLEHLHATGRRVGVISHVEELKERIPVKIEVVPINRSTSRIEVTAG